MKPILVIGLALIAFSSAPAWATDHAESAGHGEDKTAETPDDPGFWLRLYDGLASSAVGEYFRDLNDRLEHAARLDQENEVLRKKVAVLETDHAKHEEQASEAHEQARAQEMKKEAVAEGGVEASRTIASLQTADAHLLSKPPKAVFGQAVQAFDAGDYETAAKALAFLADNQENDAYQTAQVFFLAGVSLYEVGNYKSALKYLERAEKDAGGDNLPYAPRALGWIALSYEKLGETNEEKRTVRELIQRYPKSKEARRLNGNA